MGAHYSKRQIRRAGEQLAAGSLSGEAKSEALRIVGYWREAHMEPLHKTLSTLEEVCGQDESTILVSRLKRIDTIVNKLERPGYNFALTTLRDIAGCRLIVRSDVDARHVAELIQNAGQCHDIKDYLSKPQESGYRGIHLICRHDAESYGYENLNVEVQVRSQAQHDWATAVETYDMITGANLKFGNGSPDQRRYFALVAALVSHDTDDEAWVGAEVKKLDKDLGVSALLREAANSIYVVQDDVVNINRTDSCLITVDIGVQQLSIEVFPDNEEHRAADIYTERESGEQRGLVHLLARAGSLKDLRRAFPNYYSTISEFVDRLERYVG